MNKSHHSASYFPTLLCKQLEWIYSTLPMLPYITEAKHKSGLIYHFNPYSAEFLKIY